MRKAGLSAMRLGAPLAGALLLGGCVSGSDIDRLHQHISDVEKKVDALSKQSSSKEEVAKLSDTIGKQATTLLRSNADLGTRFDDLIREMQTLAGKLEDANRRLTQLSQQIAESQARLAANGAPIPPDTMTVPSRPGGGPGTVAPVPAGAGSVPTPAKPGARSLSPADLFAQATADYQRGQYDLARQGFLEYLETYPKTDLSDDAAYWIGECYAAQKKPREAIGAFDRLFRLYPQSNKSAAAHMKKGLAHLELGEKAQGIVELQFVVHEYPTSDEAKSARQRLKALGSDVR
jgi:tol-pal system protein YbgF